MPGAIEDAIFPVEREESSESVSSLTPSLSAGCFALKQEPLKQEELSSEIIASSVLQAIVDDAVFEDKEQPLSNKKNETDAELLDEDIFDLFGDVVESAVAAPSAAPSATSASAPLSDPFSELSLDEDKQQEHAEAAAAALPQSSFFRLSNLLSGPGADEIKEREALYTQFFEETKGERVVSLPNLVADSYPLHYYRAQADVQMPTATVKKILKEICTLEAGLANGMYVRFDEERVQFLRALISGPPDTPYEGGLFVFDIYIPPEYPNVPPRIQMITPSDLRFNPNLYETGLVCSSLLNQGSGWGAVSWRANESNLLECLQALQWAHMGSSPLMSEPGLDTDLDEAVEAGDEDRVRAVHAAEFAYVNIVRFGTVKNAIVHHLRSPPSCFSSIISKHFQLVRPSLFSLFERYLKDAHDTYLAQSEVEDGEDQEEDQSSELPEVAVKAGLNWKQWLGVRRLLSNGYNDDYVSSHNPTWSCEFLPSHKGYPRNLEDVVQTARGLLSDRVEVSVAVSPRSLLPGERIYIVGGREALGSWDWRKTSLALVCKPESYPLWEGSVSLLLEHGEPKDKREYKVVVVNSQNEVMWEEGSNRVLESSEAKACISLEEATTADGGDVSSPSGFFSLGGVDMDKRQHAARSFLSSLAPFSPLLQKSLSLEELRSPFVGVLSLALASSQSACREAEREVGNLKAGLEMTHEKLFAVEEQVVQLEKNMVMLKKLEAQVATIKKALEM